MQKVNVELYLQGQAGVRSTPAPKAPFFLEEGGGWGWMVMTIMRIYSIDYDYLLLMC